MSRHSHFKSDACNIVYNVHNQVVIAQVNYRIGSELVVGNGVSRRHPDDKFNEQIGINLAVGRAFESLARRLLKRANGSVKSLDDAKADRARKAELGTLQEQIMAHTLTAQNTDQDPDYVYTQSSMGSN